MTVSPSAAPNETRNILETAVTAIGWDEALGHLRRLTADRCFTPIGFLNAHNANIACRQPEFAAVLRQFLVLPDGIGVDIGSRLLYGEPFPANLNGTDFVPAFLRETPETLSVALLGTTRANAERALDAFRKIAPQHRFVLLHDGFFDSTRETEILSELSVLRPDVLLVAMGSPRQEFWIAENITADHCTLPIAVGALLDFMSGAVPRAPRWMRRLRLEWVYRLSLEPRRLFRRYVIGNPVFLTRIVAQKMRRKRQA